MIEEKRNDMDGIHNYHLEDLKVILSAVPCGAGVFTEQKEPLYLNDIYADLTGYSLDNYHKLINSKKQNDMFQKDLKDYEEQFKEQHKKNHSGMVYRIVKPDGNVIWVQLDAEAILVDGKAGSVCFLKDITLEKENVSSLKLVSENVDSGISVVLLKNGVQSLVYANDTFYEINGIARNKYNENAAVYDSLMISGEDRKRFDHAYKEAVKTLKTQNLEFRLVRRDGSVRWLNIRMSVLPQKDADTYLVASILVDQTEKKVQELELALKQSRYQLVIDEMNAAVFEMNETSEKFYCSDKYAEYAVSTLPFEELLNADKMREFVHKDDASQMDAFMAQIRSHARKAEAAVRIQLTEGGYRWVRIVGLFYYGNDGKRNRILGVIIDISKEKEQSVMLDSLLNELPGGVAIFKAVNPPVCQYYNDGFAKLSGRSRKEMNALFKDSSWVEKTVAPEDTAGVSATIKQCYETGNPINCTFRYLQKDKKTKWLHMTGIKLRDENDTALYYCVFTTPSEETTMYRNIVTNAAAGVFIGECESRRVIYYNRYFMDMFGVDQKTDFTSKTIEEVFGVDEYLMSQDEIDSLNDREYTKFTKHYHGKRYLVVRAKRILWNGIDSYVLNINDETAEYTKRNQNEILLNEVPAGIGVFEIIGEEPSWLYLNDEYFKLIQKERKDAAFAYDEEFLNNIKSEDSPVVHKFIHSFTGGSKRAYMDFRMLCGDGRYHWLRLSGTVTEKTGNKLRIYCTFSQFDEVMNYRKSLEAANAAIQSKYEQEHQKSKYLEKDIILMITADITAGVITEAKSPANNSDLHLSNISSGEFLKRIQPHLCSTHDLDRIKGILNFKEQFKLYQRGATEMNVIFRFRTKAGLLCWMQADCRLRIEPSTGNLFCYAFIKNIDDSVKKEAVTRSVIDEETDYITLLSTVTGNGRLMQMRHNHGNGDLSQNDVFPFDQFCSDTYLNEIVDEDKENVLYFYNKDHLVKLLSREKIAVILFSRIEMNGKIRRKKTRAYYLDEMHEDIVIISRDINDLYEEEQKQKQMLRKALDNAKVASRAKTDFLSNMSHEIRTPMNAIIGMTDLMMDKADDEEMKEGLINIKQSSSYLLGIINDILDMSRIENGKFTLDMSWTSPTELIQSCTEMIRPEMEKKHIVFSCPDGRRVSHIEYRVDVLKTKRMLMNLLNNAAKFTPVGGHVTISIHNRERTDHHAVDVITIEDDGCGMSEEFMTRIFTPFAQERNEYSDSVQGTGLGLALSKQIANAMGGDITAESTLGSGSKFTIIFPYSYRLHAETDAVSENSAGTPLTVLNGRHILLCEDNKLNAQIAGRLLEKMNCIVAYAYDGKEGVNAFTVSAEGYYDAVLMDIRMPHLDGLAASREIRALPRRDAGSVPIIAMSANAFNEDVQKSLAAGMNAHLAKPVDPKIMYETLAQYISKNGKKQ
jgi:PAS domain S-box-containing protein